MRILVLNGPNLQLLGKREPDVYGRETLADLARRLEAVGEELGIIVECRQSNCEGDLLDWLAEADEWADGILINPAAYTHTSVALRDALAGIRPPAVEVHISNVHQREEFRHRSLTAPVALGQVIGLGLDGYEWALRALHRHLSKSKNNHTAAA